MIPVHHSRPAHRGRARWPTRTALLAALLVFCSLQVVVIVTYYKKLSASKDRARHAAAEAAAAGEGTASTGATNRRLSSTQVSGGATGLPKQQQQHGGPSVTNATAARAAAIMARRRASRKEQAKQLLTSEHYDERRVQRLLAQLEAAEAKMASGGPPPPVLGTRVFPPGNEDGPCIGTGPPPEGAVAAVVVVTFNRARYLEQTLASLLEVHGRSAANRQKFPLFISQDFNATGVQDVVARHLDRLSYLQHREEVEPVVGSKRESVVYYRIANHYRFILRTMFECFGFQRVIILEDDMTLSPDIFSYFEATAPVLDRDPSLYCVSSWNDHGQDRFVRNATQLYRSDFFPGLGWMTNRRVWDSIRDIWPAAYWDDFMRQNTTRQGRQCIRPEVCRTYNFGDIGSSSGQYFRLFLKPITLNTEDVDWQQMDLSFLEADRYERMFQAELGAAKEITTIDEAVEAEPGQDYVLRYSSQQNYEMLTGKLRMLREWRDGVPRGAYRGVVLVRNAKGARILLAPTPDVDFNAKVVAPPGMVVRTDSTGALIRMRARMPIGMPAAEWLRLRKERLAALQQDAKLKAAQQQEKGTQLREAQQQQQQTQQHGVVQQQQQGQGAQQQQQLLRRLLEVQSGGQQAQQLQQQQQEGGAHGAFLPSSTT